MGFVISIYVNCCSCFFRNKIGFVGGSDIKGLNIVELNYKYFVCFWGVVVVDC